MKLICPTTGQSLERAPKKLLELLNTKIRRGAIQNEERKAVRKSLDGALVRKDRAICYPIREALPILLAEEGIDLHQIGVRHVKAMMGDD